MGSLFADENFPAGAVRQLRKLLHDVLTVQESGLGNLGTPDTAVLEFAVSQNRAVLTMNRKHFIRLHYQRPEHCGIIVCTADADTSALAERIDLAVSHAGSLSGQLLRVNRPA